MNKLLFVVLAIFLTAQAQNVTDNDVVQFIEGFGPAVGQYNATSILVDCTQNNVNDLIAAVRVLIQDLQNKNFTGAWNSFVGVITAINDMKSSCPTGAEPFVTEFQPAIAAFNASKTEFFDTVARDLSRDPVGTAQALAGIAFALDGQDYFSAGANFGDFVVIALAPYLSNYTLSAVPKVSVFATKFVKESFETSDDLESTAGDSTDAIEFFEGFGAAFGLESAAASLIQCVDTVPSQLLSDIENLISDAENGNWTQLATDLVQVFTDIQSLATECSEGAVPFITEFEPVVSDIENEPTDTWNKIQSNIEGNIGNLIAQTGELIQDIESSDYEKAGQNLGNILKLTLTGILPSGEIAQPFAMANFFAQVKYEQFDWFANDGESSGENSGESSGDSTDAIEFFEGFASAFGLSSAAQDLIQCVDTTPNQLVSDIENLINDVQDSNWSNVANDMITIFQAIQSMVDECSEGAQPFVTEFEPVYSDYEENSSNFWSTIGTNIDNNKASLLISTGELIAELVAGSYQNAGQSLGNVIKVTLTGILPSGEVRQKSDVLGSFLAQVRFDQFAWFENDGESSGENSGESSGDSTDAIEFLEGFAAAFGLQSAAQDLIQCVDTTPNQLISDIENLINDVQNSNWSNVGNDMISIFQDIENLGDECSEGAEPFITEFEPVYSDYEENSTNFWSTVEGNIDNNKATLLISTGELIAEIVAGSYESAGESLGNVIKVTLKGILPDN